MTILSSLTGPTVRTGPIDKRVNVYSSKVVPNKQDHIQEIIDKWLAIDDEIWAKIICMERNRRIAKAYARKHALTVNGSEDEYLDGTTLGLNSFENPDRDTKTRQIKQYIGQGLRIKITQSGDIVVKRLSKSNVFVHHHHHHQQQQQHKERQHHQDFPTNTRLRASNSSSDLYALNSETSDLYGIVGPRLDGVFSSAAFRSQVSRVAAKRIGHHNISNNAPSSAISSSDASTSSSSGACSGSGSGSGHRNSRHDEHDSKPGAELIDSKSKQLGVGGQGRLLLGGGRHSVALDYHRAVKIFDMNKFKGLLERESRKAHPNRRRLQNKCISIISFVADDQKMLNLPSWIMVINIVAIDLLRSELGLLGVHDYLGPPGTTAAVPPLDPLNDAYRFGQLARAAMQQKQALRSQPQRPPLPPLVSNNKSAAQPLSSSSYELNQQLQNNNPLSASKKAFANAAALGAYNGELHCTAKDGGHCEGVTRQQVRLSSAERCKLNSHHDKLAHTEAANISDNEHQQEQFENSCNCNCNSALQTAKGGQQQQQQVAPSGCIESCAKQMKSTSITEPMLSTHQQSSSSSGFNSHCSSQNDSSAASSSSNIAATGAFSSSNIASVCDEPTSIVLSEGNIAHDCSAPLPKGLDCKSSAKKKVPFYKHLTSSKQQEKQAAASKSFTDLPSSTLSPSQPQQSRGKRPPKLPHRLFGMPKSASGDKLLLSEPIPIPTPPTSTGACPSGKANLILVSPTGLSPPLPKRKLGLGKLAGRVSSSQMDLSQVVPELFSTIKHIDETGQCTNVLIRENIRQTTANENLGQQPSTKSNGSRNQLPPGIPAHAQLAPPATQRHILRYLMSARRGGKLSDSDAASKVPLVPPVRYQRPLPILPSQQQPAGSRLAVSSARFAGSANELCQFQQQQHDESLYYCGLQARVPLRRVPVPVQVPVPEASKHAINALLADLKLRNASTNHNHQQYPQQYSQQQERYQYKQQYSTPSSQTTGAANVFFSRRA